MATYTTLTLSDITQLTQPYDIGPVTQFEPIDGGLANSSFILTTDKSRYVLSVCDEKSPDEIALLTSALNHLNSHGFMTSTLVKTQSGQTHIVKDDNPVYLKEYIDGTVVTRLTPHMIFQVGEALARLHDIPPFPGLPQSFSYGLELFDQIAERGDVFSSWLLSLKNQFITCCPDDLPRGIIHGDLFYDNMLFENDRLKAILDLEEACNYHLIFDLGMCAAGSCCPNGELSLELTAALIDGYQSKRRLVENERLFLKDHIAYGAAATAFWRYRQFNIIRPDRKRGDAYIPMMELANHVNTMNPKTFNQAVFGDTP